MADSVSLTVPEAPRRKSSSPPKPAGGGDNKPISPVQILTFKMFMVVTYLSIGFGLAFFLGIYYVFLWEPIRGNYSQHHVYIGHSSAVFHPQ
uniref:Uncharacterized protein n=1 Tax=Octopus bimaculoides TaxID=37653 RepID=A0A0L8FQP3_OCTBM